MNSLIFINRMIEKLLDLAGILAGILIAIIGFMVTWGAISRYLFIPSHWVEPYSIYLFIASSFLGAAYAMKRGEHICVDILISSLSDSKKKVVNIFTSILALAFFSYLTWRSAAMVTHAYHAKTTDLSLLEIPLWIPQSFVFLGAVLMCLSLIWHMINIFIGVNSEENNLDNINH
jgi:C4-dicarboxylate transporter, DctQ subunit